MSDWEGRNSPFTSYHEMKIRANYANRFDIASTIGYFVVLGIFFIMNLKMRPLFFVPLIVVGIITIFLDLRANGKWWSLFWSYRNQVETARELGKEQQNHLEVDHKFIYYFTPPRELVDKVLAEAALKLKESCRVEEEFLRRGLEFANVKSDTHLLWSGEPSDERRLELLYESWLAKRERLHKEVQEDKDHFWKLRDLARDIDSPAPNRYVVHNSWKDYLRPDPTVGPPNSD